MDHLKKIIKKLPDKLVNKYHKWQINEFKQNKSLFKKLAEEGQHPSAMVISCCDSRVNATKIFGANVGEFFMHQNIANLIPPYNPTGDDYGTSAAIEFAVNVLKVKHIIVLGHSGCAGIKTGYHLCKGDSKTEQLLFVNRWLKILQPAFNKLDNSNDDQTMINRLEKDSILNSIINLLGFPFVNQGINSNSIEVHGLWNNIATGEIEMINPDTMVFEGI